MTFVENLGGLYRKLEKYKPFDRATFPGKLSAGAWCATRTFDTQDCGVGRPLTVSCDISRARVAATTCWESSGLASPPAGFVTHRKLFNLSFLRVLVANDGRTEDRVRT